MIEFIHRHPIIIKVLLTVVTLTFIITGGYMLGRQAVEDYAAKVDGQVITMPQYQDALDRTQEIYSNLYKGNIPDNIAKQLGMNTIRGMVDRKLLLAEAKKEGLSVSGKEISDAVVQNKSFQDENGSFSKNLYIRVLQQNGMTPAIYEQHLKNDLLTEKLQDMVKSSVYVTEDEARDYYKSQLALQNKPFDEKDFQAQEKNLSGMLTLLMQEKQVETFTEGLRKRAKIKVNPAILSANS